MRGARTSQTTVGSVSLEPMNKRPLKLALLCTALVPLDADAPSSRSLVPCETKTLLASSANVPTVKLPASAASVAAESGPAKSHQTNLHYPAQRSFLIDANVLPSASPSACEAGWMTDVSSKAITPQIRVGFLLPGTPIASSRVRLLLTRFEVFVGRTDLNFT